MDSDTSQRGSFLVSAIVLIIFLTAIGLALAGWASAQYQHTHREAYDQNAQLTAEAGIERSVRQLNTNDSFAGYTTPQVVFNNATQGKGTFTTSITSDPSDNHKTILSTGTVYRNGSTTPYITQRVRVTVVGTSSSGYSVYTGPGGLILGGSASIVNSAVYTNGFISLTGTATIGTQDNPLNVDVANNQCPTSGGPTYPTVCTDGTQPITMANNTAIYGSVCATGQTSTGPKNNIQPGNGGAGLKVGCTAPIVSAPTYDRNGQISAVTTTSGSTDSLYKCKNTGTTWPANFRLNGDVSLTGQCNLTITGNVYITGDLTIGGSTKITTADSVGTTRPVVMVDGKISVGGSGSIIANSSGTGIKFISFKSAAACGPNCTSLSGDDLKNSQNLTTVDLGSTVSLPGIVFQAYWGKLVLAGGGNVGAVAGQTVDMSGSGTVIFGTELSSGSRTWAITSYQRVFSAGP